TPETTVKEAIPILVKNNFRKLVVMKDNYMTGIVTQTDFVRLFNKLYESLEIKTSDLLDVNKVMTKKVLTISKGSKFSEAKNRMAKNNVGSIIVTNKKKIVGIITEYDIAAEIVENTNKCQSSSVDSIMISPVLTIYGDTNIFEANKLMVIDNVRRLPIVEDDELKGIITQTDICRAIFYFLKATYWHMDQKTLKWEKLEKVEAKKTLI
ncbi:MAG: CBS domain-containing protein, partial [archaeon]